MDVRSDTEGSDPKWTHYSDNKIGASVQENYRKKRLKWYDHVSRMKEDHIVRRMLDVDTPGKRRRGRPHINWKYGCKRDVTDSERHALSHLTSSRTF